VMEKAVAKIAGEALLLESVVVNISKERAMTKSRVGTGEWMQVVMSMQYRLSPMNQLL
jgi:hypothetical protein